MKTKILLFLLPLIVACGSTNQFAKRKYTKGVYVEKRTKVKSKKIKPSDENLKISYDIKKKNEVASNDSYLNEEASTSVKVEKNKNEDSFEEFNNKQIKEEEPEEGINSNYIETEHSEDSDVIDPKKHRPMVISAITIGSASTFFLPLAGLVGIITWSNFLIVPFSGVGIAFGVVAVILSAILLSKKSEITKKQRKIAIGALVLGILAILAGIITLVIILL